MLEGKWRWLRAQRGARGVALLSNSALREPRPACSRLMPGDEQVALGVA